MEKSKIIQLLQDQTKTNEEIGKILNKAGVTVVRWRKKYGIKVKRGSKKGKSKPWLKTGYISHCIMCQKEIRVIPSTNQKYCSKICQYNDPNFILKMKSIDRSYPRPGLRKETTPEYKRFSNLVHRLTEKTYRKYKEEINPENYKRTLAGIENGYHLDHIMSIKFGFLNKISAEQLAEKTNLRMLPWRVNISLGHKIKDNSHNTL